jgi:hypothetical protein
VKSTKESIEQASKKQRRGDTFGVAMDVSLVHSLTVQTLGGFRAFFFGVAAAAGPFRFLKPETTHWEAGSCNRKCFTSREKKNEAASQLPSRGKGLKGGGLAGGTYKVGGGGRAAGVGDGGS